MGSNCSKDPAAKAKKANGAAAVPEVTATRPIASPRPNGVAAAAGRTEARRGISFKDDRRQTQPPTSSYRSAGVDYEALEREALKENYLALKESYMKNPTQFLANQMLLSVQFFKNFDRWGGGRGGTAPRELTSSGLRKFPPAELNSLLQKLQIYFPSPNHFSDRKIREENWDETATFFFLTWKG